MSDQILVIDDDENIRELVSFALEYNGFNVDTAANGEEAIELVEQNKYDCIISDIEMPKISGLELLKQLRELKKVTPVIMLTGVRNVAIAVEVMKLGAQDYLVKPIDRDSLLLSVNKSIEYKKLLDQNARLKEENLKYQHTLEEMVTKRTSQLEEAIFGSLLILVSAIEAKDAYTKGHSNRVRLISVDLAKLMNISEEEVSLLEYGSMLHDIGKIGIEDNILLKSGELTKEEYCRIQDHPTIGAEIVEKISFYKPMVEMIRHHHERYDGKGYPDNLKGEKIPLLARIIAVADTYDAMTSTRPYRAGMEKLKAVSILKEIKGSQLDPKIVDVFCENKLYENDYEKIMQLNLSDSGVKTFINQDFLEFKTINEQELI